MRLLVQLSRAAEPQVLEAPQRAGGLHPGIVMDPEVVAREFLTDFQNMLSTTDAMDEADDGTRACLEGMHRALEGKSRDYKLAFLQYVVEHSQMQVTFYTLMSQLDSERGDAE
jgi:hypothetical protein